MERAHDPAPNCEGCGNASGDCQCDEINELYEELGYAESRIMCVRPDCGSYGVEPLYEGHPDGSMTMICRDCLHIWREEFNVAMAIEDDLEND